MPFSEVNSNIETICIRAEDAGASAILATYVAKHKDRYRWVYILSGMAPRIFEKYLGRIENSSLDILNTCDAKKTLYVSGTGHNYQDVILGIQLSHSLNIRSVAFLDHWELYRERFGYPGSWKEALPDEIWVGDNYSLDIASKEGFPKDKLKLVPNPYFEWQLNHMRSLSFKKTHDEKMRLLFVSEPVAMSADYFAKKGIKYGFTEFDVMRNLILSLNDLEEKFSELRIRLHPIEKKQPDKYDDIIKNNVSKIKITFSDTAEMIDDVAWADVVLGMESAGLVIGVVSDKPTFSYMPDSGKKCSLPHRELFHIKSFSELNCHL